MLNFDTIAAIATPIGEGAIGIVRLSGPRAIEIANQLFQEKDLTKAKSHMLYYGHIYAPKTRTLIDEVMLVVMRAPKTFTREDVVEIQCHGGIRSVQRVLDTVLETGARLAEPGEFTKRAFLNGRIDLSQAEGVIDVIRAKTDLAADVALGQLEGKLSKKVRELRQQILETLAHIEVNIDYPEYDDVEEMTTNQVLPRVKAVEKELKQILSHAKSGKIMREGLRVAIIGRPNVGKSSLLNTLVRENKAIVTNIEGTTRDIIEEYVNVQGIPIQLIDTAGIRKTDDVVEKIGVERSKEVIQKADVVLFLLNASEPLTELDIELLSFVKNKNTIIILNKNDLEQRLEVEKLEESMKNCPCVSISTKNGTGIEGLEQEILKYAMQGAVSDHNEIYLSNARHIHLLKQALQSIQEVYNGIRSGVPIDLVQIDFTEAWANLGEIIGENASDELINQLFSQFCLGK